LIWSEHIIRSLSESQRLLSYTLWLVPTHAIQLRNAAQTLIDQVLHGLHFCYAFRISMRHIEYIPRRIKPLITSSPAPFFGHWWNTIVS